MIDIFGTIGGLLEYKASLLASRGFTTLALAWFDFEDLPKSLEDVDLNYFYVSMTPLLTSEAGSPAKNLGSVFK